MSEKKCEADKKVKIEIQSGVGEKTKSLQHPVFPGGHPSKY